MKVAFVTPELYPFSKTGGLADVAQSLPEALITQDTEVTVFTPFYRSASEWFSIHKPQFHELMLPDPIWIGDDQRHANYLTIQHNGVKVVFVANSLYFDRQHCYLDRAGSDYHDNVARFSFFSRAVLEYLTEFNAVPDVIHANDWQSALIPVYLKTIYSNVKLEHVRTLLTIHNLGYQGLFPSDQIYATGLGWDVFTPEWLEFYGQLNLLKGGIVFADAVNTVSPSYAKEIQQEEHGRGLHGVMKANRYKLTGILNGVDLKVWNPETDPHLPAHFSAKSQGGKKVCKKHLQAQLGLPVRSQSMLLGVISRFDSQKGIDLVVESFPALSGLDLQLVVLGSGNNGLEAQLKLLEAKYPDQVAVRIGYDEPLAHMIEAASDAFLMPSMYEPCGLNQMYSQLYGTVPIVRKTGGLKDTVVNLTPKRFKEGTASGFAFKAPTARKLTETVKRCAKLYFTEKRKWSRLVKRIMQLDYSWSRSAEEYVSLYESIAIDHDDLLMEGV